MSDYSNSEAEEEPFYEDEDEDEDEENESDPENESDQDPDEDHDEVDDSDTLQTSFDEASSKGRVSRKGRATISLIEIAKLISRRARDLVNGEPTLLTEEELTLLKKKVLQHRGCSIDEGDIAKEEFLTHKEFSNLLNRGPFPGGVYEVWRIEEIVHFPHNFEPVWLTAS